jgi:spore coat-associated protein N
MQRITALWHDSPLKLVSALFVLSLAAMMAVASGASFTSTSANAGNIVTAGNLSHSNSKAPGAILNVSGLMPGHSDNGTVDLSNTGDGAGVFTLSKSGVANSDPSNPLGAKLTLVVEDLGDPAAAIPPAPQVKYTGKLGQMGAIDLGTWAANETHRYKFTVTFPDGGTPAGPNVGDNAYKGDNVTVNYNWESVSN